jgi:hypothetical protein
VAAEEAGGEQAGAVMQRTGSRPARFIAQPAFPSRCERDTVAERRTRSPHETEGEVVFDIHKPFYDPDEGETDWDRVEELVDLFFESPESEQVAETRGNWVPMMFEYSLGHIGVELPDMKRRDMEEVLFDLFPRKVSTEPESARDIVAQLRAFWQFLQRQFELKNAAEILGVLDGRAEVRLRNELADPSNFGMAKSFVMMGQQAGFDMTTQEGVAAFMEAYNSRLLGGMPSPGVGMPPLGGPDYEDDYGHYGDYDDDEEKRPPWNPFESTGLTPRQRAEARKKKNKGQKQAKKKKRK